MATAADVPNKFDVVIDGQGYVFDDSIDPSSVYSSRQRAQFGLSPIFVQRQNVQGDYGDEQQDFFLTFTQRDWSEGEQQHYAKVGDDDASRRFWQGTNIDVTRPGRVSLRPLTSVVTPAAAPVALASAGVLAYFATATNLYKIAADKTITDFGAHGLGVEPTTLIQTTAGLFLYLSSNQGGSVGVRKFAVGPNTFSTFSATGSESLGFLNNSLFGWGGGVGSPGQLNRYDTAGAVTTVFTFKGPDGSSWGTTGILRPIGGKLLLLRKVSGAGPDLYIYDGAGLSQIALFADDFVAEDMTIVQGVVFISGYSQRRIGGATKYRPTIYYYANGAIGKLWEADDYTSASSHGPALAPLQGNLVFTDDYTGRVMVYTPATGGVHAIASYTVTDQPPLLVGAKTFAFHTRNSTTTYFHGDNAISSSGTIVTSLIDFDSSLTKNFHGVRVEFDSASDGDGGSVDVAYRVGDVDGSYTSLATGVTSGTEVLFSGVSGKSISIKVTLNKGTSTNGAVLKRISLRASPIQPQYALARYTLALYGTDRAPEPTRAKLRDGTYHNKSGATMLSDLRTSAAKTTPIVITDEVRGTFNAIVNPEDMAIDRIHVGEYRVQLTVREV